MVWIAISDRSSPGKLADLIVFDGNPLTDLRSILRPTYVMRNGQLFDSETGRDLAAQTQARASLVDGLAAGSVVSHRKGLRS